MPASAVARSSRGDDLRARAAPEPALERRAVIARGDEQQLAAPVHARAPRLGDERERLIEVGHGGAARGDELTRARDLRDTPLDPRRQLPHGSVRRALGGPPRQHDLDATHGIDVHAYAPRAVGAANGVGDRDVGRAAHPAQGT